MEGIIRFIFENEKMAKITDHLLWKANINSSNTMGQPGEVVAGGVTNRDKTLLIQISRYLNGFVSRREN